MLPVVLKGAPFSTLGGGGGAPFLRALSTCKGWLCWYLREGAEFLPEILLAFCVLWIAP